MPIKLDSDLKVGQTVKENQIVAYDKLSFSPEIGATDNIAYCSGTLIKCALLTTDEGFEDSAIVSDKLSNDLSSDIIVKKERFLPKNTNIYNIVKEGQHVEEGESLMVIQTPYDEDDTNQLLKNLAADEDEISDLGRVSIHSKITGTVEKIKVYRTVDKSELSDSLRKLCNQLDSKTAESRKAMKKYGIEDDNELDPDYKLDPVGKLKGCQDGVLIEFYLKYTDKFKPGDKLVYYSANKGVCKEIFPVGKEPYSELRPDEKMDSLIAVGSQQGRMVTSIVVVGGINKVLIELDRMNKEELGIPYNYDL